MESTSAPAGSRFAGLTFVLTGELTAYSRKEAGPRLRPWGPKSPGPSRKRRPAWWPARPRVQAPPRPWELGIPVIDEAQFLVLIGEREGDAAAVEALFAPAKAAGEGGAAL